MPSFSPMPFKISEALGGISFGNFGQRFGKSLRFKKFLALGFLFNA